ncbi:MAG: formate dehydrogenase accessory protein FdhE [Ardenticatenaceae bacterium]|nr:formate dehydrogenase accessory protein FdhE [Ardenticatenaceae bacterium]
MATSNDPRTVLEALARQREARPELQEVIDVHHAVLTVQMGVSVAEPPPAPDTEAVQVAVEQGTPLLSSGTVQVDWDDFTAVYNDICDVVADHRPELAGELAALRAVVGNGHPSIRPLITQYLAVEPPAINDGDSDLLDFVLGSALRPFLWAQAAVLAPLVDDRQWYRSRCPVCDGEPDLAALVEEGQRRLLCSRCDTEWLYRRIGCPFCEDTDHRKLAYYMGDNEAYRLYVCEACWHYLKTVDQRGRWQVLPLPVERVLTVGMDVAAAAAGYHARPVVSAQ